MGVTDQKTLLKIRTFETDRRRIEGTETENSSGDQTNTTTSSGADLPQAAAPQKTKHTVTVERRHKKPELEKPEPKRVPVPHIDAFPQKVAPKHEPERHQEAPHKIPSFHELQKKSDRNISVTANSTARHAKKTKRRDHSFTSTTTIITDNKKSGGSFFERVAQSLYDWGESIKRSFKKKKRPKYTVQDTVRRKGVIQKATTKTGAMFTADNETLREQIRQRQLHSHNGELHVDWTPKTETGYALLEAPDGEMPHPVSNVQVQFKKRTVPKAESDDTTGWQFKTDTTAVEKTKPVEEKTPELAKEKEGIPPITIVSPTKPFEVVEPEEPKEVIEEVEEEPIAIEEPEAPALEVEDIEPAPVTQEVRPPQSPLAFLKKRDALYQTDTNSIALLIVSFVAVIAIVGFGGKFIYGLFIDSGAEPVIAAKTASIIAKADVIEVPLPELTPNGMRVAIAQSDALVPSNFTELVFVDQVGTPLSPEEVIDLMELNVPASLRSEITNLRLLTIDKSKHGLVFSVTNDTIAFGSLLLWEETLGTDLSDIVVISTLSPTTLYIDRTIYEVDVRILMDNGNEKLAYGFIDRNSFVITPNTETFTRVLVERF